MRGRMKPISKIVSKVMEREFLEGKVFRTDLDRVDVAPAGSLGILRSLRLMGDREKVKPGDPVKIITVAGERVALAGDLAVEVPEEVGIDPSDVELAEKLQKIPAQEPQEGTGFSAPSDSGWVVNAMPLKSPNWEGKVLSTVGKTAINLASEFGVPEGVTAVLVTALVRDSGASTNNDLWFCLSGQNATADVTFQCRAGGYVANNTWNDETGIIAVGSDGILYYNAKTSGTNTMLVYFHIHGYLLPAGATTTNASTLGGYHPAQSGADAHALVTTGEGGLTLNGSIRASTAVYCRVRRPSVQTITTYPTVQWQSISFTEVNNQIPFDLVMWSLAAPTQLFCRVPGVYVVTGHVQLTANATGQRRHVGIRLNGNVIVAQTNATPHSIATVVTSVTGIVPMNAGDYLELQVLQDSGGNLSSFGDPNHWNQNTFEMVRIA